MQQITYILSTGGSVTITDGNTSHTDDGTYLPVYLAGIDPNSIASKPESYERIEQDGAGLYGAKIAARTISVDLAFAPIGGSETAMYNLRRTVMNAFPVNVEGMLDYYNGYRHYQINCMVTEYSRIERQAGNMYILTVLLTAFDPHWRWRGSNISLTAAAGNTAQTTITSQTDYKVPVCAEITCTKTITPSQSNTRETVLIQLSGDELGGWSSINSAGQIVRKTVPRVGMMYLPDAMQAGHFIRTDWGLMNKHSVWASTDNDGKNIDYIRSTGLYIYPGDNTLSLTLNATAGEVELKLLIYNYARVV